MCFRSEAEIFCPLLSALQDPTPVRVILGFLSFLWLSGCFFVRRRRVSLFSPLQALGNHKPHCGLWFPLSSLPGHALRHRPVHPAPHFPPGHRPAPVFWFRCRRLALSLSLFLVALGVS